MTTKTKMNIFTLLDEIKERPSMFIPSGSLHELETLVNGYYIGLHNHKIMENVPGMTHHFMIWLHFKYGWSTNMGWAHAINTHAGKQKPIDLFFDILDKYRKIKPRVLAQVKLNKNHQPTGKQVVIGYNGRMAKPLKVKIVQYKPEKLHFLRFHYKDYVKDDGILMKPDGTYETSLSFAKNWVKEELQVKLNEWKK